MENMNTPSALVGAGVSHFEGGQEGDGLQGLAQPHFVAQDWVAPAVVHAQHPRQAPALVVPHLATNALWLRRRVQLRGFGCLLLVPSLGNLSQHF